MLSIEDRQAILESTTMAIVTQGGPSVEPTPDSYGLTCVYRSPSGRKCAIGHLIADEFYEPCLEGKTVTMIYQVIERSLQVKLCPEDIAFLNCLQQAHDVVAPSDQWSLFWKLWRERLEMLCESWELRFPEELI